jgi:hypothetical protein
MRPDQLEDDIVAQLLTYIDPVAVAEVIALPSDDGSYKRPTNIGKVVVAYDNSDYKEDITTLPMAQPEWIEIVVTLQSRTLRGPVGIYTLFALVKDALIGYTPTDCEAPISGKWFGFPDVGTKGRVDEVWTYEFHIRTKSVLVQDMAVAGPLNQGVVLPPDSNPDLTINAQLILPDPLPLQGLDDPTAPVISLIEM